VRQMEDGFRDRLPFSGIGLLITGRTHVIESTEQVPHFLFT
jgi:hypothetical protein